MQYDEDLQVLPIEIEDPDQKIRKAFLKLNQMLDERLEVIRKRREKRQRS